MPLQDSLFVIDSVTHTEQGVRYTLHLQAHHAIYRAHFPQHPITPGVCLVQIAVELAEHYLRRPLRLSQAKNIKFLAVLSPEATPIVYYHLTRLQITDNLLSMQATVMFSDTIFAKLSLLCFLL